MNIKVRQGPSVRDQRKDIAWNDYDAMVQIVEYLGSAMLMAVEADTPEKRAAWMKILHEKHYKMGVLLKTVSKHSQMTDAQVADLG